MNTQPKRLATPVWAVTPANDYKALVSALKVILFTEGTARYLLEHDPKAFEQAEQALDAIGENRSGVYPRNAARLHLSSGNEYAD